MYVVALFINLSYIIQRNQKRLLDNMLQLMYESPSLNKVYIMIMIMIA